MPRWGQACWVVPQVLVAPDGVLGGVKVKCCYPAVPLSPVTCAFIAGGRGVMETVNHRAGRMGHPTSWAHSAGCHGVPWGALGHRLGDVDRKG